MKPNCKLANFIQKMLFKRFYNKKLKLKKSAQSHHTQEEIKSGIKCKSKASVCF